MASNALVRLSTSAPRSNEYSAVEDPNQIAQQLIIPMEIKRRKESAADAVG